MRRHLIALAILDVVDDEHPPALSAEALGGHFVERKGGRRRRGRLAHGRRKLLPSGDAVEQVTEAGMLAEQTACPRESSRIE